MTNEDWYDHIKKILDLHFPNQGLFTREAVIILISKVMMSLVELMNEEIKDEN